MTYSCAAINCLCPIECLLLQRVGSFIIVFGIQRLQMSRACQLLADPWIASTYYSCKSHVARNFRPRSNQALIDPHRVTDNISYQARKDEYKFYTLLGNQVYSFCTIFMPRLLCMAIMFWYFIWIIEIFCLPSNEMFSIHARLGY